MVSTGDEDDEELYVGSLLPSCCTGEVLMKTLESCDETT